MRATMGYDRGTIKISGLYGAPFATWDDRSTCFRAPAYRYRDIVEFFDRSKVDVEDRVLNPLPTEHLEEREAIALRPYQQRALEAWASAGHRGVVVLPTGAGKTILALKAMEVLQVSTLIVAPTLPLLDQWARFISRFFGVEPGILGGGRHDLKGITVSTYDSAYLRAEEIGDKYEFVILDEAHHAAAEGYSQIGEMLASPYRLGLTATFEREDGRHVILLGLVGGVVFRMRPGDLAGKHLAEFEVIRIPVDLTKKEREAYEESSSEYRASLKRAGLRLASLEDFKKLVMRSGVSPAARTALLARNRARKIAINSEAKIEALNRILQAHRRDKVIAFTEFNDVAERISAQFLIPLITHRTPSTERQEVLDGFRFGRYSKIVTSKVLDEGLDVPDARIGIILGGTGSRREFVQRLGRILRKKAGKQAILYEVVSKGTMETRVSSRRRRGLQAD